MTKLWETDEYIEENTLTVNIARLRKKLDKAGLTDFYHTTKVGEGYLIPQTQDPAKSDVWSNRRDGRVDDGKGDRENMRDVLRYLADCRYIWMWGLLSGIAYARVFGLYGIRWEAIWYPLLLAAAFGLFFPALGFLRYRKRHRELERLDPADGPCADICPGQEA